MRSLEEQFDKKRIQKRRQNRIDFTGISTLAKKDLDGALDEVWKRTLDFYNTLAEESSFFTDGRMLYKYILKVKEAIWNTETHSMSGKEVKSLTGLLKEDMALLRKAYTAEVQEWVIETINDGTVTRLWVDNIYYEREKPKI